MTTPRATRAVTTMPLIRTGTPTVGIEVEIPSIGDTCRRGKAPPEDSAGLFSGAGSPRTPGGAATAPHTRGQSPSTAAVADPGGTPRTPLGHRSPTGTAAGVRAPPDRTKRH